MGSPFVGSEGRFERGGGMSSMDEVKTERVAMERGRLSAQVGEPRRVALFFVAEACEAETTALG